jgi:aryl-alcohol dehydrogenase-like predicted oxidoreductase
MLRTLEYAFRAPGAESRRQQRDGAVLHAGRPSGQACASRPAAADRSAGTATEQHSEGSMENRRMGRHGLEVPALCLGTMTFGLQVPEDASRTILDSAFERGLRFLDTADAYPLGGTRETVGETEAILGRWMRDQGNRDQLIIATKCFAPTDRGPNGWGLSRQHIMKAVDGSLRRLGTDYVDLYQSHGFDPFTPIEETLRAFEDLVTAGKVRYLGCSNYPAWRLGEALRAAERLGVTGYVSVQPRYNLLYREIETELLPLCRDQGLGVIVYNPLAGGLLSGKYRLGQAPEEGTRFTLGTAAERYQARYWHDSQFEAVERLKAGGAGAWPGARVGCRGLGPEAAGNHVRAHRRLAAGAARRQPGGAGRGVR